MAGFDSEDPGAFSFAHDDSSLRHLLTCCVGVEQSAQTLFEIDPDLVQADLGVITLNGESIEEFAGKIPANPALGIKECLKKCGIPLQTPNQGDSKPEGYAHGSHSNHGPW